MVRELPNGPEAEHTVLRRIAGGTNAVRERLDAAVNVLEAGPARKRAQCPPPRTQQRLARAHASGTLRQALNAPVCSKMGGRPLRDDAIADLGSNPHVADLRPRAVDEDAVTRDISVASSVVVRPH